MARAAATYFVLGKADDENFAKAEHLAETLMSALPSGVMTTSSTTLPTCPAGLTRVCLLGSDVPHRSDAT